MKRATFSILFYIKRTKLLKNGNAPVYLKITINGISSETSLKRNIPPTKWDSNRNRAKGNSDECKQLNGYLQSVQGQIYVHHQKLQEAGKLITAKLLINTFLGKAEKQITLIGLFTKHNQDMKDLVGQDYAPLTLERYEAALKHIKKYVAKEFRTNDILITAIDYGFIKGFEQYLKLTANCQHNTAMKHMRALKKVVRIAASHDYIRKDPFTDYEITIKKTNKGYLTNEEIKIIWEKYLPIERVAIVRDLFIFQCYTGLAYKDMEALTPDNIQIGIDGNKWLVINRVKTDEPCRIPLLPVAEEIIKRYSLHPKCSLTGKLLPVPSNQKMNAYLKEIADLCGIKKNLHSHLGRHTFATTVTLNNDVPLETVSKLLGHTKLSTTQLYAKLMDKKVSDDIHSLKERLAV